MYITTTSSFSQFNYYTSKPIHKKKQFVLHHYKYEHEDTKVQQKKILFLHGLCSHATAYQALLIELATQYSLYEVIAPDLFGHGETGAGIIKVDGVEDDKRNHKYDGCGDISVHIKHLNRITSSWNEPFIVIGHSMGGLLSYYFSAQHKLVERTIMINPAFSTADESSGFFYNQFTLGIASTLTNILIPHGIQMSIPFSPSDLTKRNKEKVEENFMNDQYACKTLSVRTLPSFAYYTVAKPPVKTNYVYAIHSTDDAITPLNDRIYKMYENPNYVDAYIFLEDVGHEIHNEPNGVNILMQQIENNNLL